MMARGELRCSSAPCTTGTETSSSPNRAKAAWSSLVSFTTAPRSAESR